MKIVLHDIRGSSLLSGVDDNGNTWIQFRVDAFAGEDNGECELCGAEISSGWLCMSDSTEICDDHVQFLEEEDEKHFF